MVAQTNITAAKTAAFAEIRDLGRREGKGRTARMALAEYVTARAREGLFGPDDAEAVWTEMAQGASEEQSAIGGRDVNENQADKQRASDIKHFIVLGSNKSLDGVELLDNAKERMRSLRSSGAASGRVWELLLAFARAQNKSPERQLEDHEIDRIMEDKAQSERELADVIWGARNTLLKANEGNDYEDLYEACDLIEKRVADLGGTKKQRRKAAKEEAERKAKEKEAKAEAKRKGKEKPKASTQPTTTH